MKNNKLLKIVTFFVMIVMMLNMVAYAVPIIPGSEEITPEMVGEDVPSIANNIIGSLKWIGYVIAIGMLVYIGIKYIIASADERASMKGLIVKVVIGSLIIVFANVIVNMVLSVAST